MILVFDLSGVFFNSGLKVAIQAISKEYKLDPDNVEYVLNGSFAENYRTGTVDLDVFWEKAKKHWNVNNIDNIKQVFFDSYYPKEETITLLKQLRKQGIQTAYLSNNPQDRSEYLDKKYSFKSLFDFGLFSYEAHSRKPNMEIYQKFIEKFKISPAEIIYTDDSKKNLKPAQKLGMQTIFYKSNEQFKAELEYLLKIKLDM